MLRPRDARRFGTRTRWLLPCIGIVALALARAGDRTEALRQYDRLARTLETDLDAEPDSDTTALYERLKRAESV